MNWYVEGVDVVEIWLGVVRYWSRYHKIHLNPDLEMDQSENLLLCVL